MLYFLHPYGPVGQGNSILQGRSCIIDYPILNNKINLSNKISYLNSTGISNFINYGISLNSKIIISKSWQFNLISSIKYRTTSAGTKTSNLALRFSTNYIF